MSAERVRWDPASPEFQANPYPIYAALRRAAPVYEGSNGPFHFVLLSRFADCTAVLRDPRFSAAKFSEAMLRMGLQSTDPKIAALAHIVTNVMLVKDPPDHTRLRGLVAKAFSPRVVESLRPRVEKLVDELLDELAADGGGDWIAKLASPLPVSVICELLGLPESDRPQLKAWSNDFLPILDGSVREAGFARTAQAALEFRAYMRDFVERRRAAPGDDLLSGLIAAHEQEDALSEDELIATSLLLLGAGHETTTNLLGNGLLALFRNPGELQRLRDDRSLVPNAVEEMLRFDGPVQVTSRQPKQELDFAGIRIPAGREVAVLIGAANRDPA